MDSKSPKEELRDAQKRFEDFIRQAGSHTPGFQSAPTPKPPPETEEAFQLDFDYKPRDLKRYLDRFIIGQSEAKKALSIALCDHYNYVANAQKNGFNPNYLKQNILLLGPTGVGKTYLIRCLANLIGIPFVKADATKFSETGYVGQDVDDLVRSLVNQANGNLKLAECGIIYLDEIDKLAGHSQHGGRDVSGRGVQTNLLKLMEETEVPLRASNDMQGQMEAAMEMMQGRKSSPKTINTRSILFIASGAFAELPDLISRRLEKSTIGFQVSSTSSSSEEEKEDLLGEVITQDLTEYGFEPEFVGRMPVRVACQKLTRQDLEKILTQAEGSILKQFIQSLKAYDIKLSFTDDAISHIAETAAREKTGARGLLSTLEKLLRDIKYEIPSTPLQSIEIDKKFVTNPEKALKKYLTEARKLEAQNKSSLFNEFSDQFYEQHNLRIHFTEEAIEKLVTLAAKKEKPLLEFCSEHFKDFPYGLRLISGNNGQSEFTIDENTAQAPDKTLSEWVVKSYKKVKE